jgi:hypothetical protein
MEWLKLILSDAPVMFKLVAIFLSVLTPIIIFISGKIIIDRRSEKRKIPRASNGFVTAGYLEKHCSNQSERYERIVDLRIELAESKLEKLFQIHSDTLTSDVKEIKDKVFTHINIQEEKTSVMEAKVDNIARTVGSIYVNNKIHEG